MTQSPVRLWRKQTHDKKLLETTGVILSWTEISVAPPKFASGTPYTVVLVELLSGERTYGQLVDFKDSDRTIGAKVKAVYRRYGTVAKEDLIEYGVKFKPL
ncbi:MAG: OB-fold domain-containing protein [bacterium]|nr:OB-fold domain-containing protein [bacterium]